MKKFITKICLLFVCMMVANLGLGCGVCAVSVPEITAVLPLDGSVVTVGETPQITFNTYMNRWSLSSIVIEKINPGGERVQVDYTGEYNSSTYTYALDFGGGDFGSMYEITVPASVKSILGTSMGKEYKYRFKTVEIYRPDVKQIFIDDNLNDREVGKTGNDIPKKDLELFSGATTVSTTDIYGNTTVAINNVGATGCYMRAVENVTEVKKIFVSYKVKLDYSEKWMQTYFKAGKTDNIMFDIQGTGNGNLSLRIWNAGEAGGNPATGATSVKNAVLKQYYNSTDWNQIDSEWIKTYKNGTAVAKCAYIAINGKIIPETQNIEFVAGYGLDFEHPKNILQVGAAYTNAYVDDYVLYEAEYTSVPTVSVSEISVENSKAEQNSTSKQVTLINTGTDVVVADVFGAVYERKNGTGALKTVDLKNGVSLQPSKAETVVFDIAESEEVTVYVWQNGTLQPAENITEIKTVYPDGSDEILNNPYRGLVYYEKNAALDDRSAEIAGVLYTRCGWAEIEPKEGEYNWQIIDSVLEKARQNNMMIGLGMTSCVSVMNASDYNQETPDWVFGAGAKYTLETMGDGKTLKVPVWDDAVFVQKMGNYINAFAQRYNSNKDIAFVDIRNFGNFGEWHYSSIPASKENDANISAEDLNNLVDLWKDVTLPLMMFKGQTSAKNYALETYKTGLRVDGVMNPMYTGEHKYLTAAEGVSPALGEWFAPGYSAYKSGGTWARYYGYLPILFETVINEAKVTYMGLDHWNSSGFYTEFADLCEKTANKVGYWFKPTQITYPAKLVSGTFKMTVKNDGVAPLYVSKDLIPCVKLALADGQGNIRNTLVLQGIDPLDWQPGIYAENQAEYAFDSIEDGDRLLFGVFSDKNLQNPDIELGSEGKTAEGWYELDAMSLSKPQNISANKIYTATHENAEYGYGIHRAEYAFDGDETTFWQAELLQNQEIVVDFGDFETFDKISIKPATDIETQFDIAVLGKNGWQTVYTGENITKEGMTATVLPTFAQKLKIVFKSPAVTHQPLQGELFANGGFEYDVLCDGSWFNYNTSHIAPETKVVKSGIRSMKIYDRSDGYRGVQQDITKQLEKHGAGTYNFSAYAMPENGEVHLRTAIKITYKDGTSKISSKSTLCEKNMWNSVETQLSVDNIENMDNAVLLMETRGEECATVYLDDCSLIKNP